MKKISLKREAEIIRRLHHLLSSGQGIVESLSILSKSEPVLQSVLSSVQSGKSLSFSMKEKRAILSSITIKVIEVGELTGTLSNSLLSLSKYLRHIHKIKSRLVSACIYPAIITFLSFLMVIFLLTYILPKILPIFKEMKIKLPITTRILIDLSDLLSTKWEWILAFIFCTGFLLYSIRFTKKIKGNLRRFLHHLPIIKNILRLMFLITFFRTLGIMLQSQIGIIQALYLIFENDSDAYYSYYIGLLIEHVKKGKSLSIFLADHQTVFLPIASQFISVGESTGTLSKSCTYLSEYLEHDFMSSIEKMMKGLEPLMMIAVGIVVGFISLSLISPLYELSRIASI